MKQNLHELVMKDFYKLTVDNKQEEFSAKIKAQCLMFEKKNM